MPARVAGLGVHRGLVYSHPGARVGSTPAALNTMFSRSFVSHEAVRFCSPGEPPDSDVILSRPPLGFVDRAHVFLGRNRAHTVRISGLDTKPDAPVHRRFA